MNLFISNFKKISGIFWSFLAMFLLYNIYIAVCTPKITHYQNQWQRNTAVAQEFIYSPKAENIIVGSSLSARLNPTLLPPTFFNLSFSGGSVLTGLEIIKKTGYIPKRLYVETNLIFRFKSTKMINTLFYPVWWRVKAYLPALQEKYQPLNVLLSKSFCSKQNSQTPARPKGPKRYRDSKRDINIQRFNLMMKQRKAAYAKPLNTRNLKAVKRLIHYFEKQGTQIVFFEMPIDPELANTPQAQKRRAIIKSIFKDPWLPLPDYTQYVTADGHHLTHKSAYNYTKDFLNAIQNLYLDK
ncbi:hypothetical protein YH65_02315 [Sulfurovum lithotrophicum]|uniref:Uncharacterized protein n=1 Tax=Sulfurovum lithotrophicum TaxID=206403 RepID=A0A7U4RQ05_9BACT|nr:hypothetical protein [Sulfurovum lithotrophicum]AKF24358.1 hypothetical protein YH65_02315 [Sulfurovum lithotrophicum]